MHIRTFITALLLAVPFVTHAETKPNPTWINGRPVSIHTEQTPTAPGRCQKAVEQQLAAQGWYDEIYRAAAGNKAYLIFSQRASEPCQAKVVKITFWRAVAQNGTTVMETREYTLNATEVNAFLDTELRPLASQFSATTGGHS